ncbi:hypothetical protein CC86DRAFT_117047 [Ophiobolus disseminans]|uniref:Uncharacterized protein n=1 Tax=Ophiobolus disseminans TaxID=1469910 RepID=A0A6A6ZI38_9PLEO|nr:hypothetical protein CC86DRAFT_117047 [Ophiobolus disseminans]
MADDRFPTRPAVLFQDDEQNRWYVLREPLAFSIHVAHYLRLSKETDASSEWVYCGLVAEGVKHVKMMICRDEKSVQREKIAVKDIKIRYHDNYADPVVLVDEPREVHLQRKLRNLAGDNTSILHMDSVTYQHSDTETPWKLCRFLLRICGFSPGWWKVGSRYLLYVEEQPHCNVLVTV